MSMEYRTPRTKIDEESWNHKECVTCNRIFENGEMRHEWRLQLSDQNKYLAGSFWTIHCERCFIQTLTKWRNLMNKKLKEIGERNAL